MNRSSFLRFLIALALQAAALVAVQASPATAIVPTTARVVESADFNAISADGRYIAFLSNASVISGVSTGGNTQAYRYDRVNDVMQLVSRTSTGDGGNGATLNGLSISEDGRYVAFQSLASDLVSGDTNNAYDIFVRDMTQLTPTRISVDSSEAQANGDSWEPDISDNGFFVAFSSTASNLVSGDTSDSDIFVRDLVAGTTEKVSVGHAGNLSYNASISNDGNLVAFYTTFYSGNHQVYVRNRASSQTTRVSESTATGNSNGTNFMPVINSDGTAVAFISTATDLSSVSDTNGKSDVYVKDLTTTAEPVRASVSTTGEESTGDIVISRLAISGDGRYVAFVVYDATNLAPSDLNGNDSDIFVRDMELETTSLASVSNTNEQGNDPSNWPSLSGDGKFLIFWSQATNLITGDTNNAGDIFMRQLLPGPFSPCPDDPAGAPVAASPYWNIRKTQTDEAWLTTTGTCAVTLAVIDTGIDVSQADFGGRVGKAADCTGATCVEVDPLSLRDEHGHGTAVASIAAARGMNGSGIDGIDWGVTIMPVKVVNCDRVPIVGCTGSFTSGQVENAIRWAHLNGADVINISHGSASVDSGLEDAISDALGAGVVVVAAAGNDNSSSVAYPAGQSGVLSVAGTTRSDSWAPNSNYGSAWVRVAAPGQCINVIVSSTIAPEERDNFFTCGSLSRASGTSFAAPMVSGLAALLKGICPAASASQVVDWIEDSADSITDSGTKVATGRINSSEAVNLAVANCS